MASLRRQQLDGDQVTESTMGTNGVGFNNGMVCESKGWWRLRGGVWRAGWGEQLAGLLAMLMSRGTAQSVVAYLGQALGQDVQQEAPNELVGREGHSAQLLSAVVPIAKSDVPLLEDFQTTVGDGDAKDVTGQGFQDLSCGARGLYVHNPRVVPNFRGYLG